MKNIVAIVLLLSVSTAVQSFASGFFTNLRLQRSSEVQTPSQEWLANFTLGLRINEVDRLKACIEEAVAAQRLTQHEQPAVPESH